MAVQMADPTADMKVDRLAALMAVHLAVPTVDLKVDWTAG